jgi:hypothetical protein
MQSWPDRPFWDWRAAMTPAPRPATRSSEPTARRSCPATVEQRSGLLCCQRRVHRVGGAAVEGSADDRAGRVRGDREPASETLVNERLLAA